MASCLALQPAQRVERLWNPHLFVQQGHHLLQRLDYCRHSPVVLVAPRRLGNTSVNRLRPTMTHCVRMGSGSWPKNIQASKIEWRVTSADPFSKSGSRDLSVTRAARTGLRFFSTSRTEYKLGYKL